MMSARTIFTCLILFTVNAYAGQDRGGQNALVCFDSKEVENRVTKDDRGILKNWALPHIKSIQTYDLAYALRPRGFDNPKPQEILNIKSDETPSQYIERIKGRWRPIFPYISEVIESGQKVLNGPSTLHFDSSLEFVSDTKPEVLPSCPLFTIAYQTGQNSTLSMNIDSRIYNHKKFSTLNKALLQLHEILYLHFRKLGANDSVGTRRLLSILIAKEINTEAGELISSINDTGFRIKNDLGVFVLSTDDLGLVKGIETRFKTNINKLINEMNIRAYQQKGFIEILSELNTLIPSNLNQTCKLYLYSNNLEKYSEEFNYWRQLIRVNSNLKMLNGGCFSEELSIKYREKTTLLLNELNQVALTLARESKGKELEILKKNFSMYDFADYEDAIASFLSGDKLLEGVLYTLQFPDNRPIHLEFAIENIYNLKKLNVRLNGN